MNQNSSKAPAAAMLCGLFGIVFTGNALAVSPVRADPVDGAWTATPAPTNGNCFIATTAHANDDPAGMFTTSVATGATTGSSPDMRVMLEWTPRQIHDDPNLPKRAGAQILLRLVSQDASGRTFDRGIYTFVTHPAATGSQAGLLAVAMLPPELILDLRNEASLDFYRSGTLIRHVRLDGYHKSFETLLSCEDALPRP